MANPFIPGVLHDHVTIAHGVEVARIRPGMVQGACDLLDFAGGMGDLSHRPDHIANGVCEIIFPPNGKMQFVPIGDLGFITLEFRETDDLINALQQGVRMLVDNRTLRSGPAEVGFVDLEGPAPPIEGR